MIYIVGVVINGLHSTNLIKAIYQQTLVIEIGKSHRSVHLFHTAKTSPVFSFIEKRICHFRVINEIDKTKTSVLFVPDIIRFMIDHYRNPANYFFFPISQEISSIAMLEGRIFIPAQRGNFIINERRNKKIVSFVYIDTELNKLSQRIFVFYLSDF
ncbi:hypothetical protein SDC9_140458 [bioreactor metagenome]|uniref:Uncharacterized protein n=1 Tax=bioreactor metagenome TaxID=1076179 RepID=A0A645DVG5_9ZZZZ